MRIKESLMMLAMGTAVLGAAEYTVKEGEFEQKVSLKATVVPAEPLEVEISPESWSSYPIEEVVEHGAKVKKGDVLIKVDTEAFDEAILEAVEQRKVDAMNLEKVEQELAELEVNTKRGLEKAERDYKRSVEDYEFFKEREIPEMIRGGKLSIEKAAWYLASSEEELKQLQKMYDADGLTEETEEIILKRSKNAVKSSQFSHDEAIREAKRRLEVNIPRMQKDRELAMEAAKMNLDAIEKNYPRGLELKRAEVAKVKRDDARKAKKLEEMKADRKLADIVSPADGYVYWGEFSDGGWSRDYANKVLNVGGGVPFNKVLMTVVPDQGEYVLGGHVDEAKASLLKAEMKGIASVSSNGWLKFPATVSSVDVVPVQKGSWVVRLKPEFVAGVDVVAGSTVNVDLVTYDKSAAITVPVKVMKSEDDGSYSVQVKMADGKTEKKAVKVGKVSGNTVEVLEGVEAGQVIVYEEAEKK